MVYGPVTAKQNLLKGLFLSDLIQGESIIVHLFEPIETKEKSRIRINKIVHGHKNVFKGFSTEKSTDYTCHNNVDCYSAWDDESDGVALILLSSGTELCSGSLVNNTANDYTPFFLTAFHCIDLNTPKGTLSAAEIIAAENWAFKYNYKYPECGSSQTSITYNGATYRSSWVETDFALMEMEDAPVGIGDITYLGWDNRNNAPTSGTSIHHPSGDPMKISFDNNALTSNGQTINWSGSPASPINTHWVVGFDDGTTEGGVFWFSNI